MKSDGCKNGDSKYGTKKNASEYGVRWTEWIGDRPVVKEKFFSTESARDKFVEQLEAKDNFREILALHN